MRVLIQQISHAEQASGAIALDEIFGRGHGGSVRFLFERAAGRRRVGQPVGSSAAQYRPGPLSGQMSSGLCVMSVLCDVRQRVHRHGTCWALPAAVLEESRR